MAFKVLITYNMPRQTLYLWKQAPFLRLVIPFMIGILLQWYLAWPAEPALIIFTGALAGITLFGISGSFSQYRWRWLNGLCFNILLIATGLLTVYCKDIRHRQNWLNGIYADKDWVMATLSEPLVEKPGSFKANAFVQQVIKNNSFESVEGNIIIYFKKDSTVKTLGYGSQVLFRQGLLPIKNSGNPGSFDYRRYCAFQGIYQQVWLQTGSYIVLPGRQQNWLKKFLLQVRERALHIITRYIPGKKEAGLAEALLTGYKDDLDKLLLQSYSATGVVHIIAISGMHLGLIYWLLNLLLRPLRKRNITAWCVPFFIIAGLWAFALMAGGGPSILRSAVMFTCIVVGESVQRKTFIYNSLAASAFILLCINPFWLWDAGFQLSYTAVLSIVIFSKPVYHCFNFTNKIVDGTWNVMAVTLAAQVLTTPVSIFHFHQFPIYFLVTNLVAVPLSSLIVLLEILLCGGAMFPMFAKAIGNLLYWLIYFMNSFIAYVQHLPFSLWNGLQISLLQLVLLYGLVATFAWWLLKKSRFALQAALGFLLCFLCLRTFSFISTGRQQQLIVYNVPRHQALEVIIGRTCFFKADKDLQHDEGLQDFYLNASRLLHRITTKDSIESLCYAFPVLVLNNKKIVLIDDHYRPGIIQPKIDADLLIVSNNPSVQIGTLMKNFNCSQIVFDASNAPWKVNKWKPEAAKLGLHCFYTVDNGAFVMNAD